ncbi:NTP transferase domain-containing protein [Candidatus Parcubacteria bacterium]|nr:NTP transferase domain-containing protein [Candidatus Parcubacteria bacterium]
MENKLTGVLLAAGIGKRLGAGTTKALVEIEGRPLAYYAIDFLRAVGADEIKIIGGCDYEKLKEKVIGYDGGVEVIENSEYLKGNLYTLLKALPKIENSFLICNADHIYKKAIAEKVKNQLKGITAFCDFDRLLGDDDMKVWHENFILKQISKKLEKFNGGYVGLTYCDEIFLEEYKKNVEKLLITNNDNLVVEDVVREFCTSEKEVNVGDISGYGWLEVDFPEELEKAKEEIAKNKEDFLNL